MKAKNALIIFLMILFVAATPADAKKRQAARRKAAPKRELVTRSEPKFIFDALTTRTYTAKKGKSELKIEYPESGNPLLVDSLRAAIRDLSGIGSPDAASPEAGMKKWRAGLERGENNETEVKISFMNKHVATVNLRSYIYFAGAAHGMPSDITRTLLIADGRRLRADDLAPESQLRPLIIQDLMEYFNVPTPGELRQNLFLENGLESLPIPDPYIIEGYVVFKYAPYEIAPYAAGMPSAEIPVGKIREIAYPGAQAFLQ